MIPSSSPHFPPAFYRVSIKALIRKNGRILLGYEPKHNYYSLPGGGLDWGEEPHTALRREIQEELNATVVSIADRPAFVLPHIVHNRRDMDWFYNCIICYDVEIDGIENFIPRDVYQKFEWILQTELQTVPLFEGEEGIRTAFK